MLVKDDHLANPIWFALNSNNKDLGRGNSRVKLFQPEVAPFAGLAISSSENFQALADLVDPARVVVLFSPEGELNIAPFELVVKVPGYQMVFEGESPEVNGPDELRKLTENDVREMLTLTALAQPGPFAERTIDFGGYVGIFQDGRLVAMGGKRLQSNGYTEISAVCTHPDYAGKGYARKVLNALIGDIISSGNVAYLHVREDNTRAVDLYRRMGFVIHREMYFHVIKNSGL